MNIFMFILDLLMGGKNLIIQWKKMSEKEKTEKAVSIFHPHPPVLHILRNRPFQLECCLMLLGHLYSKHLSSYILL